LPPRLERWFDAGLVVLVGLFLVGWSWAIVEAARSGGPTPGVAEVAVNPLSMTAPPPAAFLLDRAALELAERAGVGGVSGDVFVHIPDGDSLMLVDSLPPGVELQYRERDQAGDTTGHITPLGPGIWNVLVRVRGAIRTVPRLSVVKLVPLSEKHGGRIGGYVIGEWPYESGGKPRSPAYAPPAGLVRVTPENQELMVSQHFRLRDFLTKGQTDVWPKYVAMSPRLLDKLELTIDELEAAGHPVHDVGIISGFRTPEYNRRGGETGGRGELSRHMYGDAMDFFVDNNRDGRMDDLNGDGRIDKGDGRVIVEAAERVERKNPHLTGGIGLYAPTGAHSGFVHIDTRGYRARW
jgi:uncharacterized protein YcbK (DUF882 family)